MRWKQEESFLGRVGGWMEGYSEAVLKLILEQSPPPPSLANHPPAPPPHPIRTPDPPPLQSHTQTRPHWLAASLVPLASKPRHPPSPPPPSQPRRQFEPLQTSPLQTPPLQACRHNISTMITSNISLDIHIHHRRLRWFGHPSSACCNSTRENPALSRMMEARQYT